MTDRDTREDETTLYAWDTDKPDGCYRKMVMQPAQEGALNSYRYALLSVCMCTASVSARGGSGRTGDRVRDAGCASAVENRVWYLLSAGQKRR